MQVIHIPRVDVRYWTAITLASVFGANLSNFYAHESGLGIVKGLAVLVLLASVVFVVERPMPKKPNLGRFDGGWNLGECAL